VAGFLDWYTFAINGDICNRYLNKSLSNINRYFHKLNKTKKKKRNDGIALRLSRCRATVPTSHQVHSCLTMGIELPNVFPNPRPNRYLWDVPGALLSFTRPTKCRDFACTKKESFLNNNGTLFMELQILVSKRGVQIEHQRYNCYKQINKTISLLLLRN